LRGNPALTAVPPPLPVTTGIGLRAVHHDALLEARPAVGWLEAHSENYFPLGGSQPEALHALRALYPLSLHGVGLSLGAVAPLSTEHLDHLERIVRRFEPTLVSEHLSFGIAGGVHRHDLLPLPYTRECIDHLVARISVVQDRLRRPILVENASAYLRYQADEMGEAEFVVEVARRSGCGILLDINNIYVNARNHGLDPWAFLNTLPPSLVGEMHLAGHTVNVHDGREILIDTHIGPPCEAVLALYAEACRRFPSVPTLFEWDSEVPALEVLVAEAAKIDRLRESVYDDAR
jgi:uncharacterized protein (UPF0276 family)